MAAGENQKLKMLYLQRILTEETDAEHGLTTQEILSKLDACGVTADRRTLYKDLDELDRYGLEILREQDGHRITYHLITRSFELPELKLLVDSVQSARFITEKKSRQLIRKLEGLASVYEARYLHRQVLISGRIKAMNESIYYNVDFLHDAVSRDRQIRFHYYRWNVRKQMELRRDGAWYRVSPWCLMWDNENYYLVAYDAADGKIKHYRVDKMVHLSVLELPREGRDAFRKFDAAQYTRQLFGMFGGEVTRVSFEGKNEIVGILFDRFGRDIPVIPLDGERFSVTLEIAVSPNFLGWVFSLGDRLRITGPEALVQRMHEEAQRLAALYPKPGQAKPCGDDLPV